MRNLRLFSLLSGLALALAGPVFAQPTVDGVLDVAYGSAISVQTEPNSFGAGHSLEAIYVTDTATDVYVFLEGNSSFNNHMLFFMNVSGVSGDGTNPVPGTGGGGGALNGADLVGSIFDIPDIDFGFTGNSGDDNAGDGGAHSFFLDAVDYTDDATPNAATFLGSEAVTDGVTDTGTQSSSWTTTLGTGTVAFAYSDNDTAGQGTAPNVEGFEIRIPKSIIGVGAGSTATFFAAFTGGSGFFSSQVLPPVTGQGATNIGVDPDFTALAGTQETGSTAVPVELSVFSLD